MSGITVVIPLYQGARFIGETLDSLAAQTRPLVEVVVVNDGSTDDGPQIARAHPLAPRVIEQPNRGVAVARNHGAVVAASAYVAFLDQDDLWFPYRHERIAAFLERTPLGALMTTEQSFYLADDEVALDVAGEQLHHTANFPRVTDVAQLLRHAPPDEPPCIARTLDTAALLTGPAAVTCPYVFDRELLLANGGFPIAVRSIDDYLALIAVSRATPIVVLDEPSVLYRIHPASAAVTANNWALPLLAAGTALRLGGNVGDGPVLEGFWKHWLIALARRNLLDALAVSRLLGGDRRDALGAMMAWVRAKLHP